LKRSAKQANDINCEPEIRGLAPTTQAIYIDAVHGLADLFSDHRHLRMIDE
jgi:hypothetical protein